MPTQPPKQGGHPRDATASLPEQIDKLTTLRAYPKRGRGDHMTAKERKVAKEEFLKAFAVNGNILFSCRKAAISRTIFYQWCEHDDDFSAAYHQAERDFADFVHAEFVKRAMQGYDKPVVSMGKLVYDANGKPLQERVVSDSLLAMLVKRHFPEYREKAQIEHSGAIDVSGARDRLLGKLAQIPDDTSPDAFGG